MGSVINGLAIFGLPDATSLMRDMSIIKVCCMKYLVILCSFALILGSCNKQAVRDKTPNQIDGTWRMIIVQDNASGASSIKPSTISGNVEITFATSSASNGIFFGITPTNQISQNQFTLGPAQAITISSLMMTKVWETEWGSNFVNNIRSAQQYEFDNSGNLSIQTPLKKLTFQRL